MDRRLSHGSASTQFPRITNYSQTLDANRRYVTDDADPESIASLLHQVDNGDVGAMVEMSHEMEAKDAHLQGVASRRREAVTSLDAEIIPDTSTQDEVASLEAAEYCQKELDALQSWDGTQLHLADAIGPGVAVSELVWHRGQLVETVDVPGHRLISDPNRGTKIRIQTDEHMVYGLPTYNPGHIVHLPQPRAGFPLRVTITRASAYLWILKHYLMADWASFAEVFGMPFRWAKTDGSPSPADKDAIEDMLRNMASDGYGLFPNGTEFGITEANRGTEPYNKFMDWIERKQSVLYLGQTLTTEQGTVGSLALGQVHNNVKASIALGDIKAEKKTIREQVLAPMVRFRWPNQNVPVPHWQRKVAEDANIDERRLRLDEIRFAKEAGLAIDNLWLYEELNIPVPKQTDESDGD